MLMIEGQKVVTTSLKGARPNPQEVRRLVDALLYGSGFFIAKGVLSVRQIALSPKHALRDVHIATLCAVNYVH